MRVFVSLSYLCAEIRDRKFKLPIESAFYINYYHNMKKFILSLAVVLGVLTACSQGQKQVSAEQPTASGLLKSNFKMEKDGKTTDLFVLKNKNGMEVCITNLGGRIVSILVPAKDGSMKDVVLGFDSVQDYVNVKQDFGATIGRYANRIGGAKFAIDGEEYNLPKNDKNNCLHGGFNGFQYAVFDAVQPDSTHLELSYVSKDGEEGFPGNLTCKVVFTLTDDNAIDIDYSAQTDKKTVVNFTNHSYFNLSGDPTKKNSDFLLTIDADGYTPVDTSFIPVGQIEPVKGTPFDFTEPHAIGERIDADNEQLKNGHGYDHNFVLNTKGDIARPAATMESPVTGIVLQVYTNEPGIQLYAGNFLDGTVTGKKGIVYNRRVAACLETQKFPNTPNNPQWPTAQLNPGEQYHSRCIFKFSVKK